MSDPTPYVHFPGTAREALTFYGEVFGCSVQLHTFEEFHRTDGPAEAIAHGGLVKGPVSLFGSDVAGGEPPVRCQGMMLSLLGTAAPLRAKGMVLEALRRGPGGGCPAEAALGSIRRPSSRSIRIALAHRLRGRRRRLRSGSLSSVSASSTRRRAAVPTNTGQRLTKERSASRRSWRSALRREPHQRTPGTFAPIRQSDSPRSPAPRVGCEGATPPDCEEGRCRPRSSRTAWSSWATRPPGHAGHQRHERHERSAGSERDDRDCHRRLHALNDFAHDDRDAHGERERELSHLGFSQCPVDLRLRRCRGRLHFHGLERL